MNRWNHTSEQTCRVGPGFERWAERTKSYLQSRTADHWLMFAGGLLLGALLG